MQVIDAIWSMTPHGIPTKSFSARCASRASSAGPAAIPNRSANALATAHSSAADEDSPAPAGTSPSTTRSTPPRSNPCVRRLHTTPAT